MNNQRNKPSNYTVILLTIIFCGIQPILWYGVYRFFDDPKAEEIGLSIVCIFSAIIFIVGAAIYSTYRVDKNV